MIAATTPVSSPTSPAYPARCITKSPSAAPPSSATTGWAFDGVAQVALPLDGYVTRLPTYTVVYGTFSALPLFLLWLYLGWLALLAGALLAANLRFWGCLLYTSDAADERSSVDLGGRRILKKKKYTMYPYA
mgnify:CR=1 FL=1